MKLAYLDTSCLVAVAFDEPGAVPLAARLTAYDRLLSANLLEAEFRASLSREGLSGQGDALLDWVTWVFPHRALTEEYGRVLGQGYLRGADLRHLACALYLTPDPGEMAFLTLDARQQELAQALGFPALDP